MKREMVNMQMTIASLKKPAAGEAQDTGSMSISAVVSKRDRGKKYTDRADITREKTISAVWIIRKQCSGTQEKINYRKARQCAGALCFKSIVIN